MFAKVNQMILDDDNNNHSYIIVKKIKINEKEV